MLFIESAEKHLIDDNIYYDFNTGWPSQIMSTLLRRVSQYRLYSPRLKIGITSNPEGRAYQYDYNFGIYDEMILIYSTSSDSNVRTLEAALIEYYWDVCDNSIGGGGGSRGLPPYYLYIVR